MNQYSITISEVEICTIILRLKLDRRDIPPIHCILSERSIIMNDNIIIVENTTLYQATVYFNKKMIRVLVYKNYEHFLSDLTNGSLYFFTFFSLTGNAVSI